MKFLFSIAILLPTVTSTNWGRLMGVDRGECPPCICNNAVLSQSFGQGMGEGPGGYPSGGYPGGGGPNGRSYPFSGA
ncbi:hypothetical protein PMAYCL1PPCAC_29918 [Pristionchus mayeri]|uniref:Uncharacterized protein n=1 Tax=Pristionchus mayeri TaxID=1317129 RepID=A0AAN5DAW4_9BILA|nr:hypothetical protein PMAYCL1PPCAC_29918 [Pristionchus mayeri]